MKEKVEVILREANEFFAVYGYSGIIIMLLSQLSTSDMLNFLTFNLGSLWLAAGAGRAVYHIVKSLKRK